MGILGHYPENYAWRLGIVQNFCEYCQFFLYKFLGQKCADTSNSHTTDILKRKNRHENGSLRFWPIVCRTG